MRYLQFLFLISITFCISLFSETKSLTFCYSDAEAYPFLMGNGSAIEDPPGLAIDIIKEACKQLNINLKLKRLPNKRVLHNLSLNKYEGAFLYSFKPVRSEKGVYPLKNEKPDGDYKVTSISYYLYKLSDSEIQWDGEMITNYRKPVGGNTGYSIVNDLRKKGIPIDEAKTTKQNLEKLLLGRTAAFASQDVCTDFYLSRLKYKNIVKMEPALVSKDYFLLFSNKFYNENKTLAGKIWSKIAEIRDLVTKNSSEKYSR